MATKKGKHARTSPASSPTVSTTSPGDMHEGIKDTTESIVVAFILAFVFRTFMIEAFVIPTGSMAATLYGKHGAIVCEDCAWQNDYGLTDLATRGARFGSDNQVRCQNCNHLNSDLTIHDGARSRKRPGKPTRGNAEAGDRILVFKWPFDFGAETFGPRRWDVTVFKNPAAGDENFIKRLVGMPSEVLEILDGDIYSVPIENLSDRSLRALEDVRRNKYQERFEQPNGAARGFRSSAVPRFVLDELSRKLVIRRKTDDAQKAMWVVLYHHDYPPLEWDDDQPRWKPVETDGAMWSAAHRRLVFSGASGASATVRFDGKNIVDHNAYNIDVPRRAWNAVSDLRFDAVLYRRAGDGALEITLPKHEDDFTVRLNANGRVTLTRTPMDGGEPIVLGETLVAPFEPDRPVDIAFQNVDYRLAVEIDGHEVLATTPEQYAPDVKALRTRRPRSSRKPWIKATNLDIELWHVVLSRDEHYTTVSFEPAHTAGWGTANNPILLRKGEYFMLGDNSPASRDSRLWDQVGAHLVDRGENYQLGTVPSDQLIGRAFFVYWPSGLRPDWLPFLGDRGVIPNVGRMRWIR